MNRLRKVFASGVVGGLAGAGLAAASFLVIETSMPKPSRANVPEEVHQRCLQAADYLGCVGAQTGSKGKTTTVINRTGASVAEGNACPLNTRYAGGGTCRDVSCNFDGRIFSSDGHDWPLGGKDTSCDTGWKIKWGANSQRAYFDQNCPDIELKVGWKNTCNQTRRASKSTLPSAQNQEGKPKGWVRDD